MTVIFSANRRTAFKEVLKIESNETLFSWIAVTNGWLHHGLAEVCINHNSVTERSAKDARFEQTKFVKCLIQLEE